MPLPTIDDCKCSCHNPSLLGSYADHSAPCCTGASLSWTAWGMNDSFEAVAQAVAFSEEEDD